MLVYVMGSLAARIATVLCILVIALPYLLRRGLLKEAGAYRKQLRPHFWLGYGVAGFSFLHASTVMPMMGRANAEGIWAATGAFFVLIFEISVGLSLRETAWGSRRLLRRIHFWSMILLVGMLGVHLWVNVG